MLSWTQALNLPFYTIGHIDEPMGEYFDESFASGDHVSEGEKPWLLSLGSSLSLQELPEKPWSAANGR